MLLYSPIDGDVVSDISYFPKTAFLMTKLGIEIPDSIKAIREELTKILKSKEIGFKVIDAQNKITGRDYLLKIWKMLSGVPLGIAILSEELPEQTLENIFYEIGLLQAMGKETLIIKTKNTKVPSDFVRTEYIEYSENFKTKLEMYFKALREQAEHYAVMANHLERNPLVSIDYLKRAYLLTGSSEYKTLAKKIHDSEDFTNRAKNSLEILSIAF